MAKNLQTGLRQSLKASRKASLAGQYLFGSASLDLRFALQKTLDPRVTFTRASSATFIDSAGTLQTAAVDVPRFDHAITASRTNLLLRSEEFDNASWNSIAGARSITANAIASPDGTITADTVTADGTSATHFISQTVTLAAITYTYSIYAKAGTNSFAQMRVFNAFGGMFANFNLTTGVTGTVGNASGSAPTSSIQALPNGWYRCSMVFTSVAATSSGISVIITSSASVGGGEINSLSTSVHLWGAQLEAGSTATEYIPTTTAPVTVNTTESLGLLVEEQRTNLLLRSEEIDNASWGKTGSSVTADTTTAPDGTSTADKLVEDTSTGGHVVLQSVAGLADSTTFTASIFCKAAERDWVALTLVDKAGALNRVWFNVSTGTQGTTNGTVSAFSAILFANGWYRLSVSVSTATGAGTPQVRLSIGSADNTASYTGNGTSGVFFWGAQLEVGAFPTSYIPTTTAAATRSADVASITGANFSSWYRQDEGTVFADYLLPSLLDGTVVSFDDGTNNNRWQMRYRNSTGVNQGRYRFVSSSGSLDLTSSLAAPNVDTGSKSAYVMKSGDQTWVTNAIQGTQGTQSTVPAVTQLQLGNGASTDAAKRITIRRVTFWPQRLSNSTLQSITL